MYATLDQLKALTGERELIQLTDRAEPPTGLVNAGVAAGAMEAASRLIDGYLAAQYAVPLSEVPPLLADLAADVARYRLHSFSPPDHVRARYDDAIRTLKDIAAGRIRLPVQTVAAEPQGRAGVMVIESEPRRFSRSSMEGW